MLRDSHDTAEHFFLRKDPFPIPEKGLFGKLIASFLVEGQKVFT